MLDLSLLDVMNCLSGSSRVVSCFDTQTKQLSSIFGVVFRLTLERSDFDIEDRHHIKQRRWSLSKRSSWHSTAPETRQTLVQPPLDDIDHETLIISPKER